MSATVFITGNVTKEPEVKQIGDAKGVVFDVAVSTDKKQADGTYLSNYYSCMLFGKPCDTFLKKVQKGTNLSFHGSLRLEEYKKKDGSTGFSAKVTVEGKVEYNNRTKDADGTNTVRSSSNKTNYEASKPKKMVETEDSESPW